MLNNDYLRNQSIRNVLQHKLKKKQQHNAPITIRDIVIYAKNPHYSRGESEQYKNIHSTRIKLLPRLVDHIQFLASLADLYHEKAYCQPQQSDSHPLKKSPLNAITRVSLNEFSLYGKNPLTLDEFALVVEATHQIAHNIHTNVHLLLSSFSVEDEQNQLLNITLYVQGGEQAKVNIVSKACASVYDETYDNATNFSQQVEDEDDPHPKAYMIGRNGSAISSDSLINIETAGGARFLQAIDICLDHDNKHSSTLLLNQLQTTEYSTVDFWPLQVDQILTSNSIKVLKKAKITPFVFHIDPYLKDLHDEKNTAPPIDTHWFLETADLDCLKKNKYPSFSIKNLQGKLIIQNPPFGPECELHVYQERLLKGYTPTFADKVTEINNKIMNKRLDNSIETRGINGQEDVKSFHQMTDIHLRASQLATTLIKQLTHCCQPTLLEYSFQKKNHLIKQKAKIILTNATITFNQLNQEPNDFIEKSINWADTLKLNIASIRPEKELLFISEMITTIEAFQKEITSNIPDNQYQYTF